MTDIINNIISNQLRDFAGTRVAGTIVLSDELINEVLTVGRKSLAAQAEDVAEPAPETTSALPELDFAELLGFLELEQLRYRTEVGKTILELKGGISEK